MESQLVSVLVPTRNSAKYLRLCLESIRNQDYSPIEIIVIDNDSTDGTVSIAEELADEVLTWGPERCAQLNKGAKIARGKYLYRVDSDFVLSPEVVKEAVRACQSGADAVAVHNDSDGTVSYWARVRQFERAMIKFDTLIVGARFFSRDAFESVGGFDESMVAGEDYDIHNRLLRRGFRIAAIEASELHLGEPTTLWEIADKSFYYGRTIGRFISKNGSRGVAQLSPFRGAMIKNWVRFLREPTMALGYIIMITVKYGAGTLGLLCNVIGRKG